MNLSPFKKSNLRGFTLLELLISIVIMTIMSVVLFVRYPETVKRLTLANLTHTASLIVHEAQVRGSSIDSVNSSLGGYGVYLSLNNPDKIIMFGDRVDINGTISPYQMAVGDGLYETTPSDETETTTILPFGFAVSKLCVWSGSAATTTASFICNTANIPVINSLTISFIRPSPQPNIYINNDGSVSFSAGCIEFRTSMAPLNLPSPPPGHIRSVQVFSSGIIRRVNTGCQ